MISWRLPSALSAVLTGVFNTSPPQGIGDASGTESSHTQVGCNWRNGIFERRISRGACTRVSLSVWRLAERRLELLVTTLWVESSLEIWRVRHRAQWKMNGHGGGISCYNGEIFHVSVGSSFLSGYWLGRVFSGGFILGRSNQIALTGRAS